MTARCLVYGATGYTGRLLAAAAAERGMDVVLAGRDAGKLRALAEPLGLEQRAVGLDARGPLLRTLGGIDVVLNAAGPFTATAAPLVDACIEAGAHYLDLTGELDVFRAVRHRHEDAERGGVMLMPGAGFIVAPSDCLAVRLSERVGGAKRLTFGISRAPIMSRGSARTMLEMVGTKIWERRGGSLQEVKGLLRERCFDFGQGPRSCMAVNWADIYTAWFSTGAPDISAYLEVAAWEKATFLAGRFNAWWLRLPPWQAVMKAQLELLPEGPTAAQRAGTRRVIVVEAEGVDGSRAQGRLETPESYDCTVDVALTILARALAGEVQAGFRTPAQVYGTDFALELDGVAYREFVVSDQAS